MKSVLALSVLFLLLAGIEAQEDCDGSLTPKGASCPRGSAPGDGINFCRTGQDFVDRHQFPDNWRIIYDNYHYFSLFGSSSWLASPRNGWGVSRGGLCEKTFDICTGRKYDNSWAFSQTICMMQAKEILLNVTYSFPKCDRSRNPGAPACDSNIFVSFSSAQTDSTLRSSERVDTSRYSPVSGSRIRGEGQGDKSLRILRERESSNMYLGMLDTGTCGKISRVIAYYQVCNAKQIGLVRYKEFSSPPEGTTETFLATCACNAHPVTSMEVTATSDGQCMDAAVGGAQCECDEGYVPSRDGLSCEACPAGQYRAAGDKGCKPCPANTRTDRVGAPSCECLNGFFRDDQPEPKEGPGDDCQAPPGRPEDLKEESSTSSSVTLSWIHMPAASSYLLCSVNTFDIDEEVCFVTPVDEVRNNRAIVTIENLQASTSYVISVESINAVSDQDPENRPKREADMFVTTPEGVPNEPILKRLCTVVIWKPPTDPKGRITSYELCFGSCPTPSQCYDLDSSENFFLTTGTQREQDVGVYIRASNSEHTGPFTECSSIGCSDLPQGCSTNAPQTTPTTASSSPSTPPPTTRAPSPTTPSSTTAASIPTTPPEVPAATLAPSCQGPTLVLNDKEIASGSQVDMSDIGMEAHALHCTTTFEDCCKNTGSTGEWYKVEENGDTSLLPRRGDQRSLYRNRGNQVVRLNVRSVNSADEGLYRCCIPNSCGEMQCISTTLV